MAQIKKYERRQIDPREQAIARMALRDYNNLEELLDLYRHVNEELVSYFFDKGLSAFEVEKYSQHHHISKYLAYRVLNRVTDDTDYNYLKSLAAVHQLAALKTEQQILQMES